MKKFGIKWINKWSGEVGFVKEIKNKAGYFINTNDIAEIKTYKTEMAAIKAITKLSGMESNKDNEFIVEFI